MQPSFMRTVLAPASPSANPARLANATGVPLRIVLSPTFNGAATAVAYAYSVNDLTPTVSSEAFQDTGNVLIMILAPKQTLYAVGIGGTVSVALSASEAYPVV